MIRVFISYRRDDSRSTAERIYKRLTTHLGQNYLFLDQYSIPLGSDFREVLTDTLYRCDILVAVIGPQWINIADQAGERRLDDESDWVRCEIETALQRDIPIIPVLINQARMPCADELPEGLTSLAFRNALIIHSDPDFEEDMEVLIRHIQQWSDKREVFPGATVGPIGRRVYPAPKRFVSFLALFCPWLHFRLVHWALVSEPREFRTVHDYLAWFKQEMESLNQVTAYVPSRGVQQSGTPSPYTDYGIPETRQRVLRTIRRTVRLLSGLSSGGDQATAQLWLDPVKEM